MIKIIQNKKRLIFLIILLVLTGSAVYFTSHNASYYKTPIAKITDAKNEFAFYGKNSEGKQDRHYNQTLKAVILNSTYQNQEVTIENQYSESYVYTDRYQVGDEVFLSVKQDESGGLKGTILGMKRDMYVVLIASVFVLFIILVGRSKGMLSVISVCINITLFWYALDRYRNGSNILLICIAAVIFFSTFSLILISGPNKKTYVAIISTLISVGITTAIAATVLLLSEGLDYEFMEFLKKPYTKSAMDLMFIGELLIGGLGAIMDISITMSSTVNELLVKNPDITRKELINSGREIGYDIMGMMVNVLFFTYMSGCIPFFVLSMRNGVRITTLLHFYIPFEVTRFLTGGIGILLTIPLATYVSIVLMKRK